MRSENVADRDRVINTPAQRGTRIVIDADYKGFSHGVHNLPTKASRLSQLQTFMRLLLSDAGSLGRSSLIHISIVGIPSSSAHFISQSSPSACAVFFEISAMTPSQPFTRARQLVFHFSSHGSWADLSTKSNGVFGCFVWPTRKSRYFLSSIANATNTRLGMLSFRLW